MRHVSLDTAVQRAHARYPHARYLPHSQDDVADWLRHHGIEPDTEAAMELMDWLHEIGFLPGSIPTVHNLQPDKTPDIPEGANDQVILDRSPSALPAVATVSPIIERVCSNRPALVATVAARRFLDWLHTEGREGAYLAAEIEALYLEHAAATGHEPTPMTGRNGLKEALTAMGITSKTIKTGHRSGNRKERRIRNVQWQLFKTVAPAPKLIPNQAVARLAARLAA